MEGTAPPAPPSDPLPPPGARRPAGEVPPGSRRPYDAGQDPRSLPAPAGFSYAVPGPPGTGTHYHLRGGTGKGILEAGVAGGDPGRPVVVIALRAADAVDGAAAVRRILRGSGREAETVDLGGGGGCGDAGGHGFAERDPAPPRRVLRAAATASDLPALESALLAGEGLAKEGGIVMGGPAEGAVWLDVHVWKR